MDERFRRVEQIKQRVQMLPEIFAAHGLPPLEFKPAYPVGDLLLHSNTLDQEAEEKGGVLEAPSDQFAKAYKISLRLAASRPPRALIFRLLQLCDAFISHVVGTLRPS